MQVLPSNRSAIMIGQFEIHVLNGLEMTVVSRFCLTHMHFQKRFPNEESNEAREANIN